MIRTSACVKPRARGLGRHSVSIGGALASALLIAAAPVPAAQESGPTMVEHCAPILPLDASACSFRPGERGHGFAIRTNVLLPDRLMVGGTVAVDHSGRIASVGCEAAPPEVPELTCANSVVSPGFINLHEHLNYSNGPRLGKPSRVLASRLQWQSDSTSWPGAAVQRTVSNQSLALVELRHLLRGTTSIAGRDAARGLLRNLDAGQDKVVETVTFPFGKAGVSSANCGDTGWQSRWVAVVHAGEGVDDESRLEIKCLLDQQAQRKASPKLVFVHALAADGELVAKMASLGVGVVWSPCSNSLLYGRTADYAHWSAAGITIALGSDWLASGAPSVLEEIGCARPSNGPPPEPIDIWRMLTTNPAKMLGLEDLGQIRAGAHADLLMKRLPAPDYSAAVDAILDTGNEPQIVWVSGRTAYIRDVLLAAQALNPADSCHALPALSCSSGGLVCTAGAALDSVTAAQLESVLCPLPASQ